MVCVGISPLQMEGSFTRFEPEITMLEIPFFIFFEIFEPKRTPLN